MTPLRYLAIVALKSLGAVLSASDTCTELIRQLPYLPIQDVYEDSNIDAQFEYFARDVERYTHSKSQSSSDSGFDFDLGYKKLQLDFGYSDSATDQQEFLKQVRQRDRKLKDQFRSNYALRKNLNDKLLDVVNQCLESSKGVKILQFPTLDPDVIQLRCSYNRPASASKTQVSLRFEATDAVTWLAGEESATNSKYTVKLSDGGEPRLILVKRTVSQREKHISITNFVRELEGSATHSAVIGFPIYVIDDRRHYKPVFVYEITVATGDHSESVSSTGGVDIRLIGTSGTKSKVHALSKPGAHVAKRGQSATYFIVVDDDIGELTGVELSVRPNSSGAIDDWYCEYITVFDINRGKRRLDYPPRKWIGDGSRGNPHNIQATLFVPFHEPIDKRMLVTSD